MAIASAIDEIRLKDLIFIRFYVQLFPKLLDEVLISSEFIGAVLTLLFKFLFLYFVVSFGLFIFFEFKL